MRLLLLLLSAFTVSHVCSLALPDVENLDPTLLQGVIAGVPNSCGGPASQPSSSTTDQNELQTSEKRAEADLPDHAPFPDNTCPAFTNPSKTKGKRIVCPDGPFVYHLCCKGPTEETGRLYPNILNCRFSTSKPFLIAHVS